MVQQRDGRDAEAGIAAHCAWINAWADEAHRGAAATPDAPANVIPLKRTSGAGEPADAARLQRSLTAEDQLARDLAEIAQVRDALLAGTGAPEPQAKALGSRVVWLPYALRRTADSVPVLLGTVLGLLILIVFSAAAVFAKLAR